MELEEKMNLLKQNTVEMITESEIKELLSQKSIPVTYCGYEPSGELHLGHFVTMSKLLDLEKAGFKVKILLADWHAWLNKKGTWEFIHETCETWKKAINQFGFKDIEIVLGSTFQRTPEYIDDVMKLSLKTTLNRSLRSMQEVARDIDNATVSQMIYPLMQIVDIKYLNVDVAEAGIEQRKIHMLAREIIQDIDYKKPMFVHTPLINSLAGPGKKMSSSEENSMISVRDHEKSLRKKLNKAYCPEGVIENNPVLEIAKLVVFPRLKTFEVKRPDKFGGNIEFESYKELEKAFAEKKIHPMDLKNTIAEKLDEIFEPVRKAFE